MADDHFKKNIPLLSVEVPDNILDTVPELADGYEEIMRELHTIFYHKVTSSNPDDTLLDSASNKYNEQEDQLFDKLEKMYETLGEHIDLDEPPAEYVAKHNAIFYEAAVELKHEYEAWKEYQSHASRGAR